MKMIRDVFFGLACLAATVGWSESVTSETVVSAVNGWISRNAQLGCPIKGPVSAVRLCTAPNGADFYVVKLAGGGFVVTSTDTEIDPIVAFSASDDLVESDENPLWMMLTRDIAARRESLKKGPAPKRLLAAAPGNASGSAPLDSASDRWKSLITPEARPKSATAASSGVNVSSPRPLSAGSSWVSDVRVAPLLQTKWGQSTDVSGAKCFNYYTPGGCVCGCVATAAAQVLRYHRFPTDPVKPLAFEYREDGWMYEPTGTDWGWDEEYDDYYDEEYEDYYDEYGYHYFKLSQFGGVYDWDNMPYVPGRAGTADYQRQCIGKLTYDIGLAAGASYTMWDTYAFYSGVVRLLKRWGYAGAGVYYSGDQAVKTALIPNLDAKLPVFIGLSKRVSYSDEWDDDYYDLVNSHALVADGYGYSGGQFCVHLNMGWDGDDDAWYVLPGYVGTSYGFDFIDTIIGNVYPHGPSEAGIASGRIFSSSTSRPLPDVVVKATNKETGSVRFALSDANGVYALFLPYGKWTLTLVGALSANSYSGEIKYCGKGDDGEFVGVKNYYDLNFYVQSVSFPPGSCRSAPKSGSNPTGSVQSLNITPALERDEMGGLPGGYAQYTCFLLPHGKAYTFAIPKSVCDVGGRFRVDRCVTDGSSDADDGDYEGVRIVYGEDASLTYCLVDLQGVEEDLPFIVGVSRLRTTDSLPLHYVVGNFLPAGSEGRPVVLASVFSGTWSASAKGGFLNGEYWYSVVAKPGVSYDFEASGLYGVRVQAGPEVDRAGEAAELYGLSDLLHVRGQKSDRIVFSVEREQMVYILVSAEGMRSGEFTASANWRDVELEKVRALFEDYGLTTGGNAGWRVDGDSARSCEISDGGESWLEMTVAGKGSFSFEWKVSSERNYDRLICEIDGDSIGTISGEKDWARVSYLVNAGGQHKVRWTYSKDYSSCEGSDCGWVRNVAWSPRLYNISFNAGGGSCDVSSVRVADGEEVGGHLPVPRRSGYGFLGWFTSASGGAKVQGNTRMVGYDVTLYARWQQLAPGSRVDSPLTGATVDDVVRTTTVQLTPEWFDETGGDASDRCGKYYGVTLRRGGIYTFAVPRAFADGGGELVLYSDGVECEDCVRADDASLSYCRLDLLNSRVDRSVVVAVRQPGSGGSTILYYVAADYLPVGCIGRPYELPGSFAGAIWNFEADYQLRDGYCAFSVDAVPGVTYAFAVSGLPDMAVDVETDDRDGSGSEVRFSVEYPQTVCVTVYADSRFGGFTASASWRKDDATNAELIESVLGVPVDTDGDEEWIAEISVVRSGAVGDNGSTWLETTVSGSGMLAFDWMVSSEEGYDILRLEIDGETVREISGETGWESVSQRVSGPGQHTVRWTYSKDYSYGEGSDCGWVRGFVWRQASEHVITFNANGGICQVSTERVLEGEEVGVYLPVPRRSGYGFLGWFTSASGGAKVQGNTRMVGYDVTLYARWQQLAPGSRVDSPLTGATVDDVVRTTTVQLTPEWFDETGGDASDRCGKYYGVTLRRGGIYTFAVPRAFADGGGELVLYSDGVECEDCVRADDASLSYCRLDLLNSRVDRSVVVAVRQPGSGGSTILYYVAADYLPVGCIGRPYELPGSFAGAAWNAESDFQLRDGSYVFSVDAVPGVTYEFTVSGSTDLELEVMADFWDGSGSEVWFSVEYPQTVRIIVNADSRFGGFTASASWRKDDATNAELIESVLGVPVDTGGDEEWTVDGTAARSGVIGDDGLAWLETVVSGNGILTFGWKASSEEGYDVLRLEIDGETVREISGENDWESVSQRVYGRGTHTVRWTYSKDYSYGEGSDCGWVRGFAWRQLPEHVVTFNANGGISSVTSEPVVEGDQVGDYFPEVRRDGYAFLGWFTAPVGGSKVQEETRMVSYDVTLYAHWLYLTPGSSEYAPLAGPTPDGTVRTMPVSLTQEWDEYSWGYSYEDYGRYYRFNLRAGGVYTFAVPRGFIDAGGYLFVYVEDEEWCDVNETDHCDRSYYEDASLSYCRMDMRSCREDKTVMVNLWRYEYGGSTTLYYVAADYLPVGCVARPYELSGTFDGAIWNAEADFQLREYTYVFSVNAVPGVNYAFTVSGFPDIKVDVGTDIREYSPCSVCCSRDGQPCHRTVEVDPLDGVVRSSGDSFAGIGFSVESPQTVYIAVNADSRSGGFTASASWRKEDATNAELIESVLGVPVDTGGDEEWTVDGTAARSGVVGDDGLAWLETVVSGNGILTFGWKASSEEGYDVLRLEIDGETVREISGENDWESVSQRVYGRGTHTVRWTYSKDYSYGEGSDCGWVRGFAWRQLPEHVVTFNANGGISRVPSESVVEGDQVGDYFPEVRRDGYAFLGWFTAPVGGSRVQEETRMVSYDVTLYAHWQQLVPGTSAEVALAGSVEGDTVRTITVQLTPEWDYETAAYSSEWYGRYYRINLRCGEVYTFAVPLDFVMKDGGLVVRFECSASGTAESCLDDYSLIDYCYDGTLYYCGVDMRNSKVDRTVILEVYRGGTGGSTLLYYVAADYLPSRCVDDMDYYSGLFGSTSVVRVIPEITYVFPDDFPVEPEPDCENDADNRLERWLEDQQMENDADE